jgi:hypothetical protein
MSRNPFGQRPPRRRCRVVRREDAAGRCGDRQGVLVVESVHRHHEQQARRDRGCPRQGRHAGPACGDVDGPGRHHHRRVGEQRLLSGHRRRSTGSSGSSAWSRAGDRRVAALVPLAAAAVGVAAAFAAPIAFAGGGLTLFGLLGGAAIAQTQKQFKSIDTLSKAVDSAKLSLDQATRSAGKNASTSTSVANAQDRLSRPPRTTTPPCKRCLPSSGRSTTRWRALQSDFAKFIRGPAGQDLLGPFTQGLQVADDLLPKSRPIIHAVAGALDRPARRVRPVRPVPGLRPVRARHGGQIGPDIRGSATSSATSVPGSGTCCSTSSASGCPRS